MNQSALSATGSAQQLDERLDGLLGAHASLAVAYSGGVDSSVLLHAATRVLGPRALGVIADSPSLPRRELDEARAQACAMGARLVEVRTRELEDPGYVANAGQRCYHCKHALFSTMSAYAREHGIEALAFGEIADDLLDERPGRRAAREFAVIAPLAQVGMGKAQVRDYARRHGLSVADKPASACLASRLPLLRPVSAQALARIERAEESLRLLGLRQLRVRDLGARARVELGADEQQRGQELSRSIGAALQREGFVDFELARYLSPREKLERTSQLAP